MAYDIVTMGAILCEIMRKGIDEPHDRPADYIGPFPSGDAAIFINAAAKLGAKTAMIGVVGDDGFGRNNLDRLTESGCDCSMVRVDKNAATGCAFVCYFADGSRNFLFHVKDAATGQIKPEDVDIAKLTGTKWIQISGFTLSLNPGCAEAAYKIIRELPEDTKISFDPNIRPEVLTVEEIIALCAPVLERASIVFPSKGEAAMFTGLADDDAGCRLWASQGKTVVLKNGEEGCRIYAGDEVIDVPTFAVEEVDPTGAGDTFCGAFLTALIEGQSLAECGRFANAAGAMSVRAKGPMEGSPSRDELEAFLHSHTL